MKQYKITTNMFVDSSSDIPDCSLTTEDMAVIQSMITNQGLENVGQKKSAIENSLPLFWRSGSDS